MNNSYKKLKYNKIRNFKTSSTRMSGLDNGTEFIIILL